MADISMDTRDFSLLSTGKGSVQTQQPNKQNVIDTVNEVQDKVAERTESAKSGALTEEPSIGDMVEEINKSSVIRNTSLQFVFDEKGDPPVVKVMDTESGEKIRQIPSELAVKLAKAIEEMADNNENRAGILFDNEI
ncbi:flagellar protein FlaG [Idiomarina loihiensis]|uniref:flagellar protein FlaG n=1 Tax=Idiomarina TaxID=135575 RepID=UPI000D713FF5|nr:MULTISPECIES: flagellar protein FlaG [Idiomarina]PWW41706.1 flagellar protein FlaG [Idiomarina loihiensis]TDP50764.1 flagellar protein FlaG [Idiomarina loihiensis]TDS24958.1 flagellar protein FlaG [Idiomarina sp. H2]